MTFNRTLLFWRCRSLVGITALVAVIGALIVLFTSDLLDWWSQFSARAFVIVESFVVAWVLSRNRSTHEVFLHSQGFSRRTLWWHTYAAGVISQLIVWLVVAVVVWSPLRALLQDQYFENKWFPFGTQFETSFPWHWLAASWLGLNLGLLAWPAWPRESGRSRFSDWQFVAVVLLALFLSRDPITLAPGARYPALWSWLVGGCAALLLVSLQSRSEDLEVGL